MIAYDKLPRPLGLLVAAIVGALAVMVTVNVSAVSTTPNAAVYPFSLKTGASSTPVNPPADHTIMLIGTSTTAGDRGTGFVSLEHASGQFLEWTGLNSVNAGGAPTITGGFSGTAGTHIVQIDFNSGGPGVFINVNSADTFVVTNTNSFSVTGSVLMIY